MIDHLTLSVSDVELAVRFYQQALAPLGYGLVASFEQFRGFGSKGKPVFWLKQAEAPTQPMHIAFAAASRRAVDAFHAAALAAGARDDGAPGLRKDYHPNYYGAFVVDPLGHPIEAVCHLPVGRTPARPASRKPAARTARTARSRAKAKSSRR
jgi:catechol 2,3-dioxygenase-like lactoylglutathione lyase family enzyme